MVNNPMIYLPIYEKREVKTLVIQKQEKKS